MKKKPTTKKSRGAGRVTVRSARSISSLDWSKLDGASSELLDVVKPYLPALGRAGQTVFDGFVTSLLDKDWVTIDKMMYNRMTLKERQELEASILEGGRQAALDKFNNIKLTKDIAFKVALRLLMLLIA